MGRGRQKAKNTKVARELKYFSPNTDLEALQREIGSGESESDQYEDKWADMYDDEDETEESAQEAEGQEGDETAK